MTRADTEGAIRDRALEIADCDLKRRLLIDAWPKITK